MFFVPRPLLYNDEVNTSLSPQITVLVVLVILLGIVSFVSKETVHTQTERTSTAKIDPGTPPPITKHMQDVLNSSSGFQYVVTYSNDGFVPAAMTVKKGETVRFLNSSSRALWIVSSGGTTGVYPPKPNSCGQSAFDSCIALPPHDFWEFTFYESGTWTYRNNVTATDTGTIVVQ